MPMHRAVPVAAEHPRPTESIPAGQSAPRGWPVPRAQSRTSRHTDPSPHADTTDAGCRILFHRLNRIPGLS